MKTQKYNQYQKIIHDKLSAIAGNFKRVALLDFPNYSNCGDSAIWLGNLAFLYRMGLEVVFTQECVEKGNELPSLSEDVLIMLNGGGNFGDLWPRHQLYREMVVQKYSRNRVVQLPQSIHFQNRESIEGAKAIFNKHFDFHLIVRDNASLELASKFYYGATYLCPDMALCLNKFSRKKTHDQEIFGLLRTDKEMNRALLSSSKIDLNFKISDWIAEPGYVENIYLKYLKIFQGKFPRKLRFLSAYKNKIYESLAIKRFERGCLMLSKGKAVITDRLHGHLMCTLMDIPHVVLDNSYGKINNFREVWNTGSDLCVRANSISDAMQKAKKLLTNN